MTMRGFNVLTGHLYVLVWEVSVQVLHPLFFNKVAHHFITQLEVLSVHLGIGSLSNICKYFLPACSLPLIFLIMPFEQLKF